MDICVVVWELKFKMHLPEIRDLRHHCHILTVGRRQQYLLYSHSFARKVIQLKKRIAHVLALDVTVNHRWLERVQVYKRPRNRHCHLLPFLPIQLQRSRILACCHLQTVLPEHIEQGTT